MKASTNPFLAGLLLSLATMAIYKQKVAECFKDMSWINTSVMNFNLKCIYVMVNITSSSKGNDRSPESNVPRSDLIPKNIKMGHGNQRPEI